MVVILYKGIAVVELPGLILQVMMDVVLVGILLGAIQRIYSYSYLYYYLLYHWVIVVVGLGEHI